ncbi:MAG: hydroxyacid dehydrogenase [Candidatus Bathyarchaeia archaeon]
MRRIWHINPMKDVWNEGIRRLKESGCEIFSGSAGKSYSEEDIIEIAREVDAIIVASTQITGKVIRELENLRIIVGTGVGVDNIDVETATSQGVLVANTPVPEDYIGVAEGTVARILALAKRLHICDREVRQRRWQNSYDALKSVYMRGKTLGIIGLGRIGSQVAKLMSHWEMRILSYDPYVSKDKAILLGVEMVDLDRLLKESDFITVHTVLVPSTRKLIDEDAFRKMKKTAFLINTARGAVVDEEALYKALNEGWIAGAALDVFSTEPIPEGSCLLKPELAEKLILSPHVAGLSPEMERSIVTAQVDCCLKAFRGVPPEFTVNRTAIPRWKERFGTGG